MSEANLEPWRLAWRHRVAPGLSAHQLTLLSEALQRDDPLLIQGAIARGQGEDQGFPCGVCLVGFCGLVDPSAELLTVREVEDYFTRFMVTANSRPAACMLQISAFLRWYDWSHREQMRAELIPEVERSLGLLTHQEAA